MDTNKKKTDQEQGKQSTAKTDETYNTDAEELRNSPTSSQNARSTKTPGVGGVLRADENRENTGGSETDTTGKKGA